ncbi:MAG: PilZ domain-containing protein [Acidobacteria bacterium]|nr:PilZ domain-containing protein [Acidobacteriota bacterium]
MAKGKERRKFKRLSKSASLKVQVLSYQDEPIQNVSCYRDLGGGGMLFESKVPYETGTLLKIQAMVPGWGGYIRNFKRREDNEKHALITVAEVVRVESADNGGFEIGVHFVNIYENDHRALIEYIESMTDEME